MNKIITIIGSLLMFLLGLTIEIRSILMIKYPFSSILEYKKYGYNVNLSLIMFIAVICFIFSCALIIASFYEFLLIFKEKNNGRKS